LKKGRQRKITADRVLPPCLELLTAPFPFRYLPLLPIAEFLRPFEYFLAFHFLVPALLWRSTHERLCEKTYIARIFYPGTGHGKDAA
jgi:hypothetical protein